jgi:tRNA (guanosine-2'-O-)-methyltransferase
MSDDTAPAAARLVPPVDLRSLDAAARARLRAERVPQLTEARWARMREVAAQRTRHLCVVLEELYQGHNASAILRSCDCFGVQEVHAIETRNTFKANDEISLGSAQWLHLHRWGPANGGGDACVARLRAEGYKLAATSLGPGVIPLEELPLDEPVALCFGTELKGLSDTLLQAADYRVRIPMYGFTQSFNVSVSAALCLHSITSRLRKAGESWRLREEETELLLLEWLVAQTR